MNEFLPGFEPDAAERAQLRFVGGVLDLRQFDKILISVSGGKDSHAMLWLVRDLADRQGVPREKLLAMYADTGMEWHNAGAHVQALCKAAGVELATVYPVRPMIKKIAFRIERIMETGRVQAGFPTPACRYCTAEQKVAPMDKEMRKYSGKLLKVTGERRAESKARSMTSKLDGEIRSHTFCDRCLNDMIAVEFEHVDPATVESWKGVTL